MADTTLPPDSPPVPATRHLDALPPGARLAEFEIKELLGVGGFGMVYRGYDHSLHRAVAIKEYMPTSLVGREARLGLTVKSEGDRSAFESGLRSFIAEARLLARFDHPSLVKVYRFWEANNTAYMAMPLYEGITLKEARRRMSGPPPEEWLRSVLWSVLAGLKVLHDNSTLHRDVSPDNIFLQNIGPPVLLDLGAARRAILDTSQKHTAILKVNYAPIEQYADAKDLQEGAWTDLYAVAAVMHGCICNEAPLPATFRAVRDRLPPFAQVAQTAETHFGQRYSESFIRAVSHALAIEPTDRTPDVESFLQEVGMSAPPDLARFDWRKALGDSVTLVEPGTDRPPIRTELLTTQAMDEFPDTVFQPSEADHAKTMKLASQREASERLRVVRAAGSAGNARRVLVGLAGVLLIAALVWWWMRPATVPKEIPIATEAAIPALPVASEPVAASAPAGSLQPAPAAVPAAPVVAPNAGVKPPSSSQKVTAPTKPNVSATSPSTPDKSASSKAPGKPEAPIEEEKAPPVPHPAKGPLAACAEATILTRTMCIYRECQKPEFYNLPVCVADRKHWEERNKSLN